MRSWDFFAPQHDFLLRPFRWCSIFAAPALALALASCAPADDDQNDAATQQIEQKPSAPARPSEDNLFFIGQDLGAIREYVDADCCITADGATAYVGLYKVLSEELNFGGLGLNAEGAPVDDETGWNSGPVSAYKTATEFGVRDLAIGLFIAENEEPGALTALLAGAHDDKIRQLGKVFQHVEGRVFLRIGYEFDGVWNTGQEDPAVYIAAYRRIVDLLRADGAENVVFVWQASASPIDDSIEGKHEDIAQWYPGDDYVDWMALSWFLDGAEAPTKTDGYTPPTALILADELLALARKHEKPVMVAEAAPQGYDVVVGERRNISPLWDGPSGENIRQMSTQEIWDAWYAPFFQYISENDDVIDAVAYINCDWDAQLMWGPPYESGFWGDTRVSANADLSERWNTAMTAWRGR